MNTSKFLNSIPIDTSKFQLDVAAIRASLYSHGICWTDDVRGNFNANKPFRVILYTRNGDIDFKNPMVKECNGLVFEFSNDVWKLRAMPQNAFCTNKISMKKLNAIHSAGGYDVFEVLDASILTLYYYNNEWKISSTKGYDIGSTEMFNGMSYMDAIHDLIKTKYTAFRFEDLVKGHSYTIALRHSGYHIFDETKHLANRTKHIPRAGMDMNSYIMVMRVADTASATFVTKHVAGLPHQGPIVIKDNNINTLTNYARSAYDKYAKAYHLDNFKYKPLYGYILRAKHRSTPNEYSTIYIESELYRIIKLGLYKNNQFIRTSDYNKLVVQMSTNHDYREHFRIMFQQFESKFQKLEDVADRVAAETTQQLISDEPDVSDNELISELVSRFKTEPDITSGIIKDAIITPKYVDQLAELLQ